MFLCTNKLHHEIALHSLVGHIGMNRMYVITCVTLLMSLGGHNIHIFSQPKDFVGSKVEIGVL